MLGVGRIGILDFDSVAEHNLHRQSLYAMQDVGKPKVVQAKRRLLDLNPSCEIQTYQLSSSDQQVEDIINDYDVVVECTDDPSSKFHLNDIALRLNKLMVYAAIYKFEGQLSVFGKFRNEVRSLRDLFDENTISHYSCEDHGVLATVTGVLGMLQANEVIKILAGIDSVLFGELMVMNVNSLEIQKFDFKSTGAANTRREAQGLILDLDKLDAFVQINNPLILNVGTTALEGYDQEFINSSEFERIIERAKIHSHTLVVCNKGITSLAVARRLKNQLTNKNIMSLEKGAIYHNQNIVQKSI